RVRSKLFTRLLQRSIQALDRSITHRATAGTSPLNARASSQLSREASMKASLPSYNRFQELKLQPQRTISLMLKG
ncbi:hypothetical protein, partial [Trichocoleus sp. FACHB-262]|uniref:hypothetical protein n=1 Tax=Trichocoleus sp. FACHB-262 TaxID=2692869 RepID=UPI0037DCB536